MILFSLQQATKIQSMVAEIVLILAASFVMALYSLKKIIYISHKTHLFDEPSEDRKIHRTRTPKLGGVAIFTSVLLASFLFLSYTSLPHVNFILFACFILFILGVTDDLVGVNPAKKIFAQTIAVLVITILGDYRFTSFGGLFGLTAMPYALSIALSSLFILFLINAFNLIDGINCLAGGIGLLACFTFAFFFSEMRQEGLLFTSLAMCGALAAFLLYNRTPARIFMGDTGSILLGFIISLFSINFIELNASPGGGHPITGTMMAVKGHAVVHSPIGLVFALLIIPMFDTLRVFTIRLFRRKSPFLADRNHIHHRIIDLDLTHLQSTGILLIANIVALLLALMPVSTEILILCLTIYALALNGLLTFLHIRRRSKQLARMAIPVTYKQGQSRILIQEIKPVTGR
jgi:UDP-N-acetylmuramyl pentapeptide phosphotransferase/UDP-N-acetylglucosamine-1-phosphate transferase